MIDMASKDAMVRPPAWGVAALLLAASDALQARLGAVTVRGELSGFNRASSGHCYFNLKDSDGASAMLRCAMFRRSAGLMDFRPSDGQRVELQGRVTVYEARGELQCVVEAMRPLAAGSLFEIFLRLKAKLTAEGLFDDSRKRPLPTHPRALGIVTSLQAAALRDVLTTLARRAPQVRLVIYPCTVQGAQAAQEVVQAIGRANARGEVDALLICRGGGSMEDLWAFNDEHLARAIAASRLPTICGIGHETDFSLADLAADVRASTPTASAELAAPAQSELLAGLVGLERRILRMQRHRLDGMAQQLDLLAVRWSNTARSLMGHRQQLVSTAQRVRAALAHRLQLGRQALAQAQQAWARSQRQDLERRQRPLLGLAQQLALLDPKQVLARGYSLVETASGEVLMTHAQLKTGQVLRLRFAHGQAELTARNVKRLDD